MAYRTLTIEYDTDQEFFWGGDESLLDYLVNEFDNHGFVTEMYEEDEPWNPDELVNASKALFAALGGDIPARLRTYIRAVERALPRPETSKVQR